MSNKKKKILALILVLAFLIPTLFLILDFDGDGLSNVHEYRIGTDSWNPDTDADGLDDFEEVYKGQDGYITDPMNQDTDSDGLSDGEEASQFQTNPLEPDSDIDGLSDYLEVYEFGTNPNLLDTDGDRLSDYEEVYEAQDGYKTNPVDSDSDSDGLSDYDEIYSHETDPNVLDTDGDRLSDYEEVYEAQDGYETNPLEPDTDKDGLSDYEEAFEYESNPNLVDTDYDGAWDSIDSMPDGFPEINWHADFDPGLIRFSLDVEVYSLWGRYARKWVYQGFPFLGSCEYIGDDNDGATKSSDVNPESVVDSVNSLLEEEQNDFLATNAMYRKYEGTQYTYWTVGLCEFLSPRYRISYGIDREIYEVSFMNTIQTTLRDSIGTPYWFTWERIPVERNKDQTLSLQFHLSEDSSTGGNEVPGFAYYVYENEQFEQSAPILESVSPGIDLGNGVYQADLHIDQQTANAGEITIGDGRPAIALVLIPVWIETQEGRVNRSLEPSSFNMVASNHRYTSHATLVVVRQGLNVSEVNEAIPDDVSTYAPGTYRFGLYDVCVARSPSSSECSNLESEDAIIIISDSMMGLQGIRFEIDWGDPGIWYEEQRDRDGEILRTFGYFLDVLEYDRQLFGIWRDMSAAPLPSKPQSSETSVDMVQVQSSSDGKKRFNSYEGKIQEDTEWEEDIGSKKSSKRWTMKSIGVFRDPEKSQLREKLGDVITKTLKGAKIGTIVVSNGREAWLAYEDGDNIQGSLYVAKGGVGTFSVLAEDRTLGSLGIGLKALKNVPAAKLAKITLGIFSNGYAVSKIGGASNEFDRRVLIHQASTGTMDFVFSVVLGWAPFYVGWNIGVTIAYAILPNDMAAKIMSSPFSFVAFIWTSYFTRFIPKEVAEDALNFTIKTAVESAQWANQSGRPAVVVLP